MKCKECGIEKKPSQRLLEELKGVLIPCNNPKDIATSIATFMEIIKKIGKVLDEMVEKP